MRLALLAGLLAAGISQSAHADLTVAAPPPSNPPPAPVALTAAPPVGPSSSADHADKESHLRWYGWQSMTAGGIGATLLFIGAASDMDGGGDGAVAAYVWGGIIYGIAPFAVHMSHKAPLKAVGSIVMLTGMPLTGYFIGMAAGKSACASEPCRDHSATWGALAGVLAAPIIDGLALGWTRSRHDDHAELERAPHLAFSPVVEPRRGGASVGIAGTF